MTLILALRKQRKSAWVLVLRLKQLSFVASHGQGSIMTLNNEPSAFGPSQDKVKLVSFSAPITDEVCAS